MTTPQKAPTVGVVKWFDVDKGFGFISTDRGDLFFHASQLSGSSSEPREGDNVHFSVALREDGRSFARKVAKT